MSVLLSDFSSLYIAFQKNPAHPPFGGEAPAQGGVVKVRNVPSQQALSNLIGSIYDCALDPSLWERTLVELRDAVSGRQAAIRLSDVSSGGFLIYKAVGIDPHWEKEHTKHVSEVHTYLAGIQESSPSFDEPYVVSRRVPRAYRDASRYGHEFLRPQGLVDNMFWFLMKTPTRFGRISVARHEQQGIYTDAEFDIGVLLLPHLRRAMTISNVLDAQTIERARMAEALDALRCVVILCDQRGTILHANRSAEDMLRDGTLVGCVGKVLSTKRNRLEQNCARRFGLRQATSPPSAKVDWPSACPNPTCRPCSLTSCR